MNLKTPLWSPDKKQLEQANLTRFIKYVEESTGKKITDYETLYQWSIDEKESFWSLL